MFQSIDNWSVCFELPCDSCEKELTKSYRLLEHVNLYHGSIRETAMILQEEWRSAAQWPHKYQEKVQRLPTSERLEVQNWTFRLTVETPDFRLESTVASFGLKPCIIKFLLNSVGSQAGQTPPPRQRRSEHGTVLENYPPFLLFKLTTLLLFPSSILSLFYFLPLFMFQ